jgi:hypothetical protein
MTALLAQGRVAVWATPLCFSLQKTSQLIPKQLKAQLPLSWACAFFVA